MRPIFTIHAGEYLVADYLERNKNLRIWVPSKDEGIDLLVTNQHCDKAVSLQVKFSKSFGGNENADATGWWYLDKTKIEKSPAKFWVFVLTNNLATRKLGDYHFLIITPRDLLHRLREIHGDLDRYQVYLWVSDKTAIETRDAKKQEKIDLFRRPDGMRDFSQYLDNWEAVLRSLR